MAENKMVYNPDNQVLSVKNLQVNFKSDNGMVHAVRGVSFDLYKGETLCIVGESGSGKSVTSKTIMGILPNNAIISNGQIIFEGEDLVRVSEEDFHRIRGNKIGMIFQDPLSALNPLVKVGKQIIETSLINSNILKKKYQDIIGDDLTALRNLEANRIYETNRIHNQVNENNKILKEYKTLSRKLTKAKYKEQSEKSLSELNVKVNSYIETVLHGFENDLVDYKSSLERNKIRKEKYVGLKDPTEDKVPVSLRVTKYENRVDNNARLIELIEKYQKDNCFRSGEHTDRIKLVNEYLIEKKKLVNENSKISKPILKEIFNLRKKSAQAEVDAYEAKLIVERDKKVKDLEEEKANIATELKAYDLSLDEEIRTKFHKIIEANNRKLALRAKNEQKFKETSISSTKKETFTLDKLGDEKYEGFLNKIDEINKKIDNVKEDFVNKTKVTKQEAKRKALEVMKEVGIPLPERRFKQYPFEFSGGMRQRIVIAIALTANPEILICDEPTTALDVTIQAQILELINKLKRERNLSCIFITHDLGVVANMADRVAVMYAGKIVEYGLANEVFFEPKHPYTWALLSSIPDVDSKEKLEAIPGTPPDMIHPPKGDAFALRSKYAMDIDFKYEPPYFKISPTHYAATWLLYPGAPKVEMPSIVKTRIENALKAEKERVARLNKEAK